MKKILNFLKNYSALIAILVALISVINAIQVFHYTKELNKSSISLKNVAIKENEISGGSLQLRFLFNLQITGNEPLNIISISSSYFNFKDSTFTYIYKNHSILNKFFPGAIFNQPASLIITNMKDLDNTKINQWFNMAIMMKIDYETPSIKEHVTYYMKYDDSLEIHHLSSQEYDLIEPYLPEELKLEI